MKLYIDPDFIFEPTDADSTLDSLRLNIDVPKPRVVIKLNPVPHCDCQDAKEAGAMYPVDADSKGACTLCHSAVFWKPLTRSRKQQVHGTALFRQGCRCLICCDSMKEQFAKQNAARKLKKGLKNEILTPDNDRDLVSISSDS